MKKEIFGKVVFLLALAVLFVLCVLTVKHAHDEKQACQISKECNK